MVDGVAFLVHSRNSMNDYETSRLATDRSSPPGASPSSAPGSRGSDGDETDLVITSTAVLNRTVTVSYTLAGSAHTALVLIDSEVDHRGWFDFACADHVDCTDAQQLTLESTALAAYQRDQEECRLPRFVACGEVRA